jgi:[NiFe] hydrogenase assembly HybE family chaperone
VNPRRATSSEAHERLRALVRERARAIEFLYRHIAATRMDGVPILHPGLAVAAVGFEADADRRGASGVLVTPWFMNLVWLPLPVPAAPTADRRNGTDAVPDAPGPLALGATRERAIGHTRFPFIGAGEEPFGPFEACSLFSPMFEFEDHAAALATARAVLEHLRQPAPAARAPAATHPPASAAVAPASDTKVRAESAICTDDAAVDTRRRWLFGRGHSDPAAAAR